MRTTSSCCVCTYELCDWLKTLAPLGPQSIRNKTTTSRNLCCPSIRFPPSFDRFVRFTASFDKEEKCDVTLLLQQNFWITTIVHFTVMNGGEASNLPALLCNSRYSYMLSSVFKGHFHNKVKEVCIKTMSPSASHSLEGQVTQSTTVKRLLTTTENTIIYHNALCLSPQHFA